MTFGGTILLLIGSMMLFGMFTPKIEYFPTGDPQYVNVFVDLPLGSDIESTNDIAKEIEADIRKGVEPYSDLVEEILTQIGEETSDPNSPPEPGVTPHKARITVSFIQYKDRDGVSTGDAMQAIRDAVREHPGVTMVIDKDNDGPPTGLPINIEVIGKDMSQLLEITDDMKTYLNSLKIAGVEGLKTDVVLAKPEMEVHIDRESARRYGLSTAQIASTLRTSVYGKEVSKYKVGEDEFPIMVRLNEDARYNTCLLYTSPSPRDLSTSRMPSSA